MTADVWRPVHLVAGEESDADLPDLYLRGGAILPLGPVVQHTGQWDLTELELVVSLDADGRATGVLYEDDGDGYGYRTGAYRLTRFAAVRDGDEWVKAAVAPGDGWPAEGAGADLVVWVHADVIEEMPSDESLAL